MSSSPLMHAPSKFPVKQAPWYVGGAGKAWQWDLIALERRQGIGPEESGTLGAIAVEAVWAHPIWHSYVLMLMHLRPVRGMEPPLIVRPGATHEFHLFALDPEQPIDLAAAPRLLTPANFAAQLVCPGDAAAMEQIEGAARNICDAKLNPDTDYIRHWMHRFGDHLVKDKDHAGETKIILNPGEADALEIVIPPRPGPQDMH